MPATALTLTGVLLEVRSFSLTPKGRSEKPLKCLAPLGFRQFPRSYRYCPKLRASAAHRQPLFMLNKVMLLKAFQVKLKTFIIDVMQNHFSLWQAYECHHVGSKMLRNAIYFCIAYMNAILRLQHN